jgi:hypothetical protein
LAAAHAGVPRYIRLAELGQRVDALNAARQAALWRKRNLEIRRHVLRGWTQNCENGVVRGAQQPWILTSTLRCPMCSSEVLHRSHRYGYLEWILSFASLPFRCDDCGTRFFVSRIPGR